MKRDYSRDALPRNAAWNLVDYIPSHLGAPLRKRGGWSYASPNLTGLRAATASVLTVGYGRVATGNELVAVDEDGVVWRVASTASATNMGTGVASPNPPVIHRDRMIFLSLGSNPKSYNGTTVADLSGSAPQGYVGTVYKDRTVIAGPGTQPQRIYFSAAGDPATWDTTNSYIDASSRVNAVAALSNSLLVFTERGTERIRGSIPPSATTTGDMVLEPLWEPSAAGGKTLVVHDDRCYFASNTRGCFATDGTALVDLTRQGGIASYWASLTEGVISVGFYRGFLLVVWEGGGNDDGLAYDIERHIWWRFTPPNSIMFARSTSETYFAIQTEARVGSVSSMFSPSAAVKNDADGTAIAPVLETPFYGAERPGKKSWRRAYVSYDLRDAATDNPTLSLSYITSPEATSYTAVSGTFPESAARTRQRKALNATTGGVVSEGIGLKVTQTNASSDTRLYALEADLRLRERSRI
jgi:hypothetical protein